MKQITEKTIEKVTTAFIEDVEYILKACMGKTLTFLGINSIMSQIERKQAETVLKMKTILSENENPVKALDEELWRFYDDCDTILTVELEDKVCCYDFEHLMDSYGDLFYERYQWYFSNSVEDDQDEETLRREC